MSSSAFRPQIAIVPSAKSEVQPVSRGLAFDFVTADASSLGGALGGAVVTDLGEVEAEAEADQPEEATDAEEPAAEEGQAEATADTKDEVEAQHPQGKRSTRQKTRPCPSLSFPQPRYSHSKAGGECCRAGTSCCRGRRTDQ